MIQQKGKVSAVDAATQAAAAYVWQASYTEGRKDGWAAGWAAAFGEQGKPAYATVTHEESQKGHDEDDKPTLELTEECARLFARSAKAQKRDKVNHRESPPNDTEQFDLGGLLERQRRRDAVKLYGADARQIAEVEADLAANFGQMVSETGASYWPVVSLRDGERPQ